MAARSMWQHYADTLLETLPKSSSRCQHKSFADVFRSSRLATLPKITNDPPNYFTRHQHPYPRHQVITAFNSAHRRGDWGLKRPLPPVKDANIVIEELDTIERQTPYVFASEKPRFVRRMKEYGLVLTTPDEDTENSKGHQYNLNERVSRRKQSPLEDYHPQWNRKAGGESGPWVLGLKDKQYTQYLRDISERREELTGTQQQDPETEAYRLRDKVRASLDVPVHQPAYKTHATAGLTYSAPGSMASTPDGVIATPGIM